MSSEHLYICLFAEPDAPGGYFHWVLAMGNEDALGKLLSSPLSARRPIAASMQVDIFQIRLKQGEWECEHHDSVSLKNTGHIFRGTVPLGPLLRTKGETKAFINGESPSQGDTPLLWIHLAQGRGWSCAQWLLRVLEGLIGQGFVADKTAGVDTTKKDWKAAFYMAVNAKGTEFLKYS
ncbi:hypothetical protein B0H16DRAFT_1712107 [Mycena metata]|uniref:Uncharacterized protein n=1 Tax=Mycena metata TaxID=1033252 RepID=A0AAD7K2M4_9AGAR|nr:hypothetical protein B0H16DRAFT_1712107 [Mycena metata]